MSLFRSSVYSAIQTVARMGVGLINVKIAAVYLGPAGVGLYGQLWSLFGVFSGPLTAPISTVLTREIASTNDSRKTSALVGQTLRLAFLFGLFPALAVIPFAETISQALFYSPEYHLQVMFAVFALFPIFVTTAFAAAARGSKLLGLQTIGEILVALSGTMAAVALMPTLGLHGAFWSLPVAAAIGCALLLILYRKKGWLGNVLSGTSDKVYSSSFRKFLGASIVTATTIAFVPILLRNGIAEQIDLDHVGYWQAGTRLSDLFFSLFATLFAMHFLPRFSELNKRQELVAEIRKGATAIAPIIVAGAALLYSLLDFIVPIIYTNAFLPLKQIMGWQLAGMVLQTAAWFVRYVIVAKGHAYWIAATDVGFSLVWLALAFLLLPAFGLAAVSIAYCVRYLLDALYSAWKCRAIIMTLDAI